LDWEIGAEGFEPVLAPQGHSLQMLQGMARQTAPRP
jgi:hypothetical protein